MPWIVRVRKKFQAAHYLTDYPKEGENEPLHGHTWMVECHFRVEELNKGIWQHFPPKVRNRKYRSNTCSREVFPPKSVPPPQHLPM